jgi:hypothetical protein
MHRFYFHLHECGTRVIDEEGRELPSLEVALKEAVIAARCIMGSDVVHGRLCLNCHIEIADSYGITLAAVPFAEALEIQP